VDKNKLELLQSEENSNKLQRNVLEKERLALLDELNFLKHDRNLLIKRLYKVYVHQGNIDIEKKDLETKESRNKNQKLLTTYFLLEAKRLEEVISLNDRQIEIVEKIINSDETL